MKVPTLYVQCQKVTCYKLGFMGTASQSEKQQSVGYINEFAAFFFLIAVSCQIKTNESWHLNEM